MWIETSKGLVNTAHVALVKWSLTGSGGNTTHELDLFLGHSDMRAVSLDEDEGMRFVLLLRGLKDTAITLPDELAPVALDKDE